MKLKIMIVLLVVAAAWVMGRQGHHGASAAAVVEGQKEIHQTFRLAPGAQVEVKGINGSVDVETADTDSAEVHIFRTAKDAADLDRQQVVIEQTPNSLSIYTKKTEGDWFGFLRGDSVRDRVTLRLPRRIQFTTKGVNGPVKVAAVEGPVRVAGVNGRVEVAQSAEAAEVAGVNGGVTIGVVRLGGDGLTVKGINGGVEIRLAPDINADVDVKGLNGGVSLDVPNVTTQERERARLHARIGAGGTPITITGVNGGVRFVPAAAAR